MASIPMEWDPQFSKWSSLLIKHNNFCFITTLFGFAVSREWNMKYPTYSKESNLEINIKQTLIHPYDFSASLYTTILYYINLTTIFKFMFDISSLRVSHRVSSSHSPPQESACNFKLSQFEHLNSVS